MQNCSHSFWFLMALLTVSGYSTTRAQTTQPSEGTTDPATTQPAQEGTSGITINLFRPVDDVAYPKLPASEWFPLIAELHNQMSHPFELYSILAVYTADDYESHGDNRITAAGRNMGGYSISVLVQAAPQSQKEVIALRRLQPLYIPSVKPGERQLVRLEIPFHLLAPGECKLKVVVENDMRRIGGSGWATVNIGAWKDEGNGKE